MIKVANLQGLGLTPVTPVGNASQEMNVAAKAKEQPAAEVIPAKAPVSMLEETRANYTDNKEGQEKVAAGVGLLEPIKGVNLSMLAARDANAALANEDWTGDSLEVGNTGYRGKLKALAAKLAKATTTEKLPDFDPIYGRYIGQAYKVPTDMAGLQKVYTKLMGRPWENKIPGWLEHLGAESKEQRLAKDIAQAIAKGSADTKGLRAGELASLLYPRYVLHQSGKVIENGDSPYAEMHPMVREENELYDPLYKPLTQAAIKKALAWRKSQAVGDSKKDLQESAVYYSRYY